MKKLRLLSLILAFATVTTTVAHGATSTSKIKTSVKEPTKTKKQSDKQRQALSQGYSASEALLMSDSRWSFIADTSLSRTFDEISAETVFSTTSLSANYRLNKSSVLGLSLGYETIAKTFDGDWFTNNQSAQPDRFGFTDLSVRYSLPNVVKLSPKTNITYTTSVDFPSGRTSQRAGMYVRWNHAGIMRYRINSRLLLSLRANMSAAHFRYECQNASCTVFGPGTPVAVNSPFGAGYSASLSYNFTRWLTATGAYRQFYRYDYKDDWRTIQTAVAALNFNVTSTVGVYTAIRWRDLTLTNDEMFDDDKSLAFIGVSYAF